MKKRLLELTCSPSRFYVAKNARDENQNGVEWQRNLEAAVSENVKPAFGSGES